MVIHWSAVIVSELCTILGLSSWTFCTHSPRIRQAPAEQSPRGPPRFTSDLKSLVRYEGQSAHFETRLTPADDDRMIVEWYQNDHPMASGNRFKSTCDFGYVSMDIGQVSTEDEGVYYVRAYNDQGETYLQAELTVHPRPSLLLETQHPESLAKIRALEAPHGRNIDDTELENVSPYFVVQLNSCLDLVEGQPAHFEAQVQPTTDNKLRIEWYHNGRQLQDGSRFNMKHDFGLVVLDISGCIAEDSGAYICRAINEMGQAQTSADLICKGE
uniref:Ig-like domain-containing protein n=1 Tax=Romanomermis culicivorax TaxID=13658 RepID=A0A915K1M5_ROMCU